VDALSGVTSVRVSWAACRLRHQASTSPLAFAKNLSNIANATSAKHAPTNAPGEPGTQALKKRASASAIQWKYGVIIIMEGISGEVVERVVGLLLGAVVLSPPCAITLGRSVRSARSGRDIVVLFGGGGGGRLKTATG